MSKGLLLICLSFFLNFFSFYFSLAIISFQVNVPVSIPQYKTQNEGSEEERVVQTVTITGDDDDDDFDFDSVGRFFSEIVNLGTICMDDTPPEHSGFPDSRGSEIRLSGFAEFYYFT